MADQSMFDAAQTKDEATSKSEFLIQVIEKGTGRVLAWAPGLEVERLVLAELAGRLASKKVGIGRTTATVVASLQEAFKEVLFELKKNAADLAMRRGE